MPEPRKPGAASAAPPASVEEALARARAHARAAAGEAALAARALLDALSLAASGAPSDHTRALAWAAAALDDAARGLGRDAPGTSSLLGAVAEALDAEIARWETRASVDRDARAVLRAYLGLREILWELGLRAPKPDAPGAGAERARSTAQPEERPRRGLQRVRVDG
jgi:hypothetical protein